MANDRKVELEQLSEEVFNDLLNEVNEQVLNVSKKAQDKINKLLSRFNIECSLTLNYRLLTEDVITKQEKKKKPKKIK